MSEICEHLEDVPIVEMPEGGCIDCLAIGGRWVSLRFCVTCETTRCCDSSPNRHARAHWNETGHPVVRSKEPGDSWAWCYDHEIVRQL
ncbi:MAG TPA: UBP-type zinc finger domain-containing protein [Acidimicrobiia bacterium]|nr:UBP-type zinc finger domain-containing protein [Acidimicrobiia bacterium]